jgi:hypothetical protein
MKNFLIFNAFFLVSITSATAFAKDWRVANFPTPNVQEYSIKRSGGCDPSVLFHKMKADVDSTKPDLVGVYNFGLAVDTTESQGNNISLLARWIDYIYSSVPQDAKVAFSVVEYGDSFRAGFLYTGDKNYSLTEVKKFLISRRIHGGGDLDEDVNGATYNVSFNLKRQHGVIFNVTNATGSNTMVKVGSSRRLYTLKDLESLAKQQIHVIRIVYFTCM